MNVILLTVAITAFAAFYLMINIIIYVFVTVDPNYEILSTRKQKIYDKFRLLIFGIPIMLWSVSYSWLYELLSDVNVIYLLKTLREKQFTQVQFEVACELVRCYKFRPFTFKCYMSYLAANHILRNVNCNDISMI